MAGSQTAWGLDIGTTAVKAVKLRRDGDRVAVEAFDVVEHDKFLSEPDVNKDDVIRTTLQKFIDRNNPRETLFIGVSGAKTFARFVKLPPVEPKKIPEIVKFEAIQQIPFPLEQVNWDYQTFTNPDSPEVEVGIFAMKKELVALELANFQAQRLTVHGVQMAPLALYNAAVYDEWTDDKGTVVIDIGAEHTDLVVLDQGRLWLRSINIGGNNFTEALAKAFKQPFKRAEQLKKSAATSKYQKQIFQAMRPIFADLVAEIQRSMGHYQQTHRDSHLERIVAVGNPFKLPNLQKYIQQELKMEVIRLEHFKKANVDTKLAAGMTENLLSLSVAYGLALQGLDKAAIDTNLLPLDIARQMLWARKRPWFAAAALLIAASAAVAIYATWRDSSAFAAASAQEASNDSKVAAAARLRDEYTRTASDFDLNRSEVESVVKLAEARAIWPQMLQDIYGSLPQAHSTVRMVNGYPADRRFIVLTGLTSDYSAALSGPITGPNAAAFLDDEAPPPGAAGAPGAAPGAPPGGPPRPGMPGPGGPNAAAPGTAITPAGPSDRGFLLSVTGYVPAGANPQTLINDFKKAIKAAATQTGSKPYYFRTTQYTLDVIPAPKPGVVGAANTNNGPWGKSLGDYKDLFVPEMMFGPQALTSQPAVGGILGVDQAKRFEPPGPMDPMTKPATPMFGYALFEFKVRAFVK